ncbi:MAG: hypothetical protein MUE40_21400 [Anaerolineae bacterium]|jgi:hypothetical protein|nr:hypothetical protein [Anaerolineae bacterium]
MGQKQLLPYAGLLITGVIATLFLLLEGELPLTETEHLLLQILWVGVAFGALLAWSLQPALPPPAPPPAAASRTDSAEVPPAAAGHDERYDQDRLWLQQHPGDDIDDMHNTPYGEQEH